MSVFKQIELFFRGIFRAGPTYRRAKAAERSLQTVDRRLDSGEEGLRGLSHTLNALSDRLGKVERDLDLGTTRDAGQGTFERIRQIEAQLGLGPGAEGQSMVGRVERVEGAVFFEGRNILKENETALAALRTDLASTAEGLSALTRRADRAAAEHALVSRAYSDLSRRLDRARFAHGEAGPQAIIGDVPAPPEGLDAILEAFYARLEDRFRGSREEIKGRLGKYLADAEAAYTRTGGKPMLDLGCGRGEWIELLGERGFRAEGIDINPQQTAEATELGLTIHQGDALAHLAEAPEAQYSLISAHHLIEHLPFERVVAMTRDALRALAPGGVLIYETPNPRNVLVGATTFHIDPTHNRPLPAEVLEVLFDTVGFHPVDIRHLHPTDTLEGFVNAKRVDPHIATLLFGPQDLAVVGVKPAAGG